MLPSMLPYRSENILLSRYLFWDLISKSLHNVRSIKMGPRDLACAFKSASDNYWKL